MSDETINLSPSLLRYVRAIAVREPDVLRRLREETHETQSSAGMQISPEQGALLGVLVRLAGARKILEIGVFTGYSSTAMALAMPADGKLYACDVDAGYTAVARRYWEEAGVADRIELTLAPAVETIDGLLASGHEASFDIAFIDADKTGYVEYYRRALRLVRAGGLVAVDNTLWGGAVIDPEDERDSTEAIRELNETVARDEQVDMCLVPIGDGLTLAVKR